MLATAYAAIEIVILSGYAVLAANANALFRRSGMLWLNRTCGGALLTSASMLVVQQLHASS